MSKTQTNEGEELDSLYEQNLRKALALSKTQTNEGEALDSRDEQDLRDVLALSRTQANDDRNLDPHRYEQYMLVAAADPRPQPSAPPKEDVYDKLAACDYQFQSGSSGLGEAAAADPRPKPSAPPKEDVYDKLAASDYQFIQEVMALEQRWFLSQSIRPPKLEEGEFDTASNYQSESKV